MLTEGKQYVDLLGECVNTHVHGLKVKCKQIFNQNNIFNIHMQSLRSKLKPLNFSGV